MNILIITQDDPFYLPENFQYLLENIPSKFEIVGVIKTKASPFGKRESFLNKTLKTFKIFGLRFFIHYTFKFVYYKVFKSSLSKVLKKNNISEIILSQSVNSKASLELIKKLKPDLIVSILGNQIFKKELINLPSKGCINLHTALLPKYRGLMPTFWVLKNNEEYTGVSVFFMDEGIDSGPIITQKRIKINNMTQASLIKITKRIGMELIIDSMIKIYNKNLQLIPNCDEDKSYFSFPTKEDVRDFYNKRKKFF